MKMILILMIMLCLTMTGCAQSTQYGECIGLNGDPVPGLVYKYSVRNIILELIFIETIVVPVVVIFNGLECPVARTEVSND